MSIRETTKTTLSGWLMLPVLILAMGFTLWRLIAHTALSADPSALVVIGLILLEVVLAFCLAGFFVVYPNQARVLTLFGKYVGSVNRDGFHWANPFLAKKRISLRIRNFESKPSKVNDREGNPIEIGAVIVWRVVDSAEASFEVDDYVHFVKVQTESAVRNLATEYPYDSHEEGKKSLRGNTAEIADQLKEQVQGRLAKAGVEVMEARINHLAYAPEIAAAMLQRQQAGAIIAARQRIVDGAVGMVEMALEKLASRAIVELDNDRKAAMVSNLLVVLCSDRSTQPIVNTGTIYQ
jgi:regulator of protease activity HflC (stomatin/prohibitin superfamily)